MTNSNPNKASGQNPKPAKQPDKEPAGMRLPDMIKSRLEPDHSKPVDKKKLVYSIVILVLAVLVIGLLQSQGF